MANKPKKSGLPQKPRNGWKIYFTAEEVQYLEAEARRLGYKSAQKYVEDKFRQERLQAKLKA
jgi:hypothetical protein